MLEIGGYPDLIEESRGADDRGQVRSQHFDRDLAVVFDVSGEIAMPSRRSRSIGYRSDKADPRRSMSAVTVVSAPVAHFALQR